MNEDSNQQEWSNFMQEIKSAQKQSWDCSIYGMYDCVRHILLFKIFL